MISALFVFCMRWGRVSIMQVVPHCSCIQALSLQKWTPAFYSSYVQCHMKKLRCGHSNKNKKCTHILTRNEDQLVRTGVTTNPQRGKKHCGSGRLGKWSHISYQEAESWRKIRKKWMWMLKGRIEQDGPKLKAITKHGPFFSTYLCLYPPITSTKMASTSIAVSIYLYHLFMYPYLLVNNIYFRIPFVAWSWSLTSSFNVATWEVVDLKQHP